MARQFHSARIEDKRLTSSRFPARSAPFNDCFDDMRCIAPESALQLRRHAASAKVKYARSVLSALRALEAFVFSGGFGDSGSHYRYRSSGRFWSCDTPVLNWLNSTKGVLHHIYEPIRDRYREYCRANVRFSSSSGHALAHRQPHELRAVTSADNRHSRSTTHR